MFDVPSTNEKSPPHPAEAGQSRDKSGAGSSPCSLSHADIRRPIGCQLPDAILHGKRSFRPRSRAAQHLAITELSSEAFQLAWAGGCATGLRTRSRHVCNSLRVLTAWPGSATAFSGAFARSHGSRLFTLRLLFAHSPAVSFLTSPALGRFSRNLPSPRVLPGAPALFVRLSTVFAGRSHFFMNPPESFAPC